LSRIEAPVLQPDSNVEVRELSGNDDQWNRIIMLELVPHPNHAWKNIVARDFGITKENLTRKVRTAVADNLVRLGKADCGTGHHLAPAIHHLWLHNTDVLRGIKMQTIAPGADG